MQALEHEMWLLNEKLSLTRESITVLDSQVDYQLSALPGKINRAMEEIVGEKQTINQQYGGIVSAIVAGRLVRILGGTILDQQITAGDVLATVVGPSLLSASYAASRVARVCLFHTVFTCATLLRISDQESSAWM